jgi:hypothetical protein
LIKLANISEVNEQVISDIFQARVEKAKTSIKDWWKRHYNFSRTDERYLSATEEDIIEDYIDEQVAEYIRNIGSKPMIENDLRGMALDPLYAEKLNEQIKKGFEKIEILSAEELEKRMSGK